MTEQTELGAHQNLGRFFHGGTAASTWFAAVRLISGAQVNLSHRSARLFIESWGRDLFRCIHPRTTLLVQLSRWQRDALPIDWASGAAFYALVG